jgi:predicted RecB family nuclease
MQPDNNSVILPVTRLRSIMECQRRIWLDTHGDPSECGTPSAAHAQRLEGGVTHEEAIHIATVVRTQPISVADWDEGIQATRQSMQRGVNVILGGYLEAKLPIDGLSRPVIMRGRVDRLEKRGQRGAQALYIPVEIKRYTRLSEADHLQLDAYVWLLEQSQGVQPPFSGFWLGARPDGQPAQKVRHTYDEMRLWSALELAAQLVANTASAPPVRIALHCRGCLWYSACLSQAVATHDVSLLSGLHKNTREHFQDAGIVSLQQIVIMSVTELRQFKNIGAATAPAIHAQARAWIEQRPIWLQPMPDLYRQESWFFDIETDPVSGEIWSIGWSREDEPIQLVVVAPHLRHSQQVMLPHRQIVNLAPDTDAAWRCFADSVSIDQKPIFHWTGFDASVMRATAPEDVTERLNHRLHDFHGSFKKAVQLPADGTSLKTVAAYFGFTWSEYADWRMAWSDYQRWLVTENDVYLAKACAYQGDDVRAMVIVRNWCQRTVS